jgi:rhomboid protease GluP
MPVTCPQCGKENVDGARRCAFCDTPLESTGSAAPLAESPPAGRFPADTNPRNAVPLDPEALARDRFVHALFTNTPHTYVTWTVMAINIVVFLLMAIQSRSIGSPNVLTSLAWGASYGPAITTHGEWWRMLTGAFVHAGLIHVAANMYVLAVMGPLTERLYGNATYAVLYLLAALSGSLASIVWHPLVPSVGASGAVFGVMGGVLAYTLRQRRLMPSAMLNSVASVVGQNVAINLVLNLAMPHVDMAAHVGGLIGGFVFGLCLAGPIDATASHKVRSAAATAVAGLLLLIIVLTRLPKYDDWIAMRVNVEHLAHDVDAQMEKLADANAPEPERRKAADQIEQRILPRWTTVRTQAARVRVPDGERESAAAQVKYMDLAARAWGIYAQFLRTRDLLTLKAFRDAQFEAQKAWAALVEAPAPKRQSDQDIDALLAWDKVRRQADEANRKAAAAYNVAVQQLSANQITQGGFAEHIETTVIPPARQAYDTVAQFPTNAQIDAEHAQLAKYLQLRLEAWTLMASGARTNSIALVNQAKSKMAEAETVARPAAQPAPH